jgi:hypothetical protein
VPSPGGWLLFSHASPVQRARGRSELKEADSAPLSFSLSGVSEQRGMSSMATSKTPSSLERSKLLSFSASPGVTSSR